MIGLSSETDTHWRCTGSASFNWRMKFKLKTDVYTEEKSYKMVLQLWDKDIISSNDYLSSISIDGYEIYNLLMRCMYNDKSAKYYGQVQQSKKEKIELNTAGNPSIFNTSGSTMYVSIECLTEEE